MHKFEWPDPRFQRFQAPFFTFLAFAILLITHHPVHAALTGRGPYIAVLVELPEYGGIRMVGNLLGDPLQAVTIGAPVSAVFEPHDTASPPFTLVQWRLD